MALVYKGIGPKGNAVFLDQSSGETITRPGSAGEGLTVGGTVDSVPGAAQGGNMQTTSAGGFDVGAYLGGLNNKQLQDIAEFGPDVPKGVDRGEVMRLAEQKLASGGGTGSQAGWTGQQRQMYDNVMNGTYSPAQVEQVIRTNGQRLGLTADNIPQQYQQAYQKATAGAGVQPDMSGMGSDGGQRTPANTAPNDPNDPSSWQGSGSHDKQGNPVDIPVQSERPEGEGAGAADGQSQTQAGDSGTGQYAQPGAGGTQTGLIGAEQALAGGLQGGLAGVQQARQDIMEGTAGANQAMDPFYQQGLGASQNAAALTGSLGADAQQEAYNNFQESPGQAWLREQTERGVTRNAAATGGLRGGRVLQELQRNAAGLAAQDFDNSFNRLSSVADRGVGAGNVIANNRMNAGQMLGGAAQAGGQMAYGTGNAVAQGRTRAGEQMAQGAMQTGGNMAQLINQAGRDQSQVIGEGGANLANLLSGAGIADANQRQQLAAMLANIASGSASNIAGLPGLPGTQQKPGALAGIGAALEGGANAAAAMGMSDPRLKANVSRIGTTPGGLPWYTWDWTEEAKPLVGEQPAEGVMATEVPLDAVAVGDHGFLMVDYTRIA